MTFDTQFDRLVDEHAALLTQYGSVQKRCSRLLIEQARDIERLQAEVMQLRAAVVARDSALAYAREDRAALEASIPGLPRRIALARHVETLMERIQTLTRESKRWQWWGSRPAARVPVAAHKKAVLCIGQDASDADVARELVETAGGRFLHHDGNAAIDTPAFEASLVAADLVICQTGCVSHDAYWRAQDHCKRTGKQCVMVDRPQVMHLVRSVTQVDSAMAERAPPNSASPLRT